MHPVQPSPEHAAEAAAFRAALRRERIAARLALSAADHMALSARVAGHLAALLAARPAETVAFCAPVRGEFDARPLVADFLARGWSATMPVATAPASPMNFRAWTPGCSMTTDRHGIPIPAEGPELVPDVVLLPLVAFDAAGYRIGYGGGYFDRTLAGMVPRPFAVGVGFELARVPDTRPQAHDVRLDAIVTEAGVQRSG